MSDTQGADDTGSGGLENDMPGIGNAPSSPRMVPSALGGLAGFAQRALGIGRPAPQAPPPGRSPFQYPGQSQLPVPPQRGPNAPRWEGTTASLILPKGSPQPHADFNPYTATTPKGDYANWGQPEDNPDLPQSFEVPGLYKSLGNFFGQQGGPAGPLGLLLAGHTDAYLKGVMMRQEFNAKNFREKMLESAYALEEQQRLQHTTYADRMMEYFETAGESKEKAGNISINGMKLREALHQDAMKLGDTDFVNMIENGASFDQLMRYQDYRDARLKDLQKANQKTTEQDAEDAAFEGKSSGGGTSTSPANPFEAPGQQAQPQEGGGEPSATPSPTPGGGAPPQMVASNDKSFFGSPDVPAPDAQNVSNEPTFNPDKQAAIGLARGDPSDTLPSKGAARGRVLRYHAQLMDRMNRLAANAENMTPDEIYDQLGKDVDPVVARDLKRIVGGAPIPGGWSQVGSRPYWQNMQNMARAIKPGWLPQDAANLQNFELGYNHGVEGQRMMRAAIMGSAGVTLLDALNKAEKAGDVSDNAIVNKWNRWRARNLNDDPLWSNVFAAYQAYVQENSAVATAGKPYEGDIQRLLDENPITGGPKIIRGVVSTDARNAFGALTELNEDYQHTLQRKDNAPHFNERNVGLLRGLTHLQSDGSFDNEDDVPPALKALASDKQKGGGVIDYREYFK